ncbi:MAG: glucokinase [Anaerolineaceae bacterium]|nr:glucokinase [Anaerolineaceae bacterium]
MLLVGDIGGTNTRLALYSIDGVRPERSSAIKTYSSQAFMGLTAIVDTFLNETGAVCDQAVFGVAGPVDKAKGESQITNLPWLISVRDLQAALKTERVSLLNDVESISYGLALQDGMKEPDDLFQLNRTYDSQQNTLPGNKALIAPGTGLGESILIYDDFGGKGRYIVNATEGGHTDYAPRSTFEAGLLHYLQSKFWEDSFGHISYERVCSGQGIKHIYDYLKESNGMPENPDVARRLAQAEEPANKIISEAALSHSSELCMNTLNTFVSILGAECGNMALKTLAFGGVYLGGGIPPKILEKLKDGSFIAAFLNKGRFASTLIKIPVYVILKEEPGLFGAACYAKVMQNLG